jgi:hypothetical protein
MRWYIALYLFVLSLAAGLSHHTIISQPRLAYSDIPALDMRLYAESSLAVVGAAINWRIEITPLTDQEVLSLHFIPGNTEHWQWLDLGSPPALITTTTVLTLTAVPLASGELTPLLEARYLLDRISHSQLVSGNEAVSVETVDSYLQVRLISQSRKITSNKKTAFDLQIYNGSPFLMKQVVIEGKGLDLEWGPISPLMDLKPGDSIGVTLKAKANSSNPQP